MQALLCGEGPGGTGGWLGGGWQENGKPQVSALKGVERKGGGPEWEWTPCLGMPIPGPRGGGHRTDTPLLSLAHSESSSLAEDTVPAVQRSATRWQADLRNVRREAPGKEAGQGARAGVAGRGWAGGVRSPRLPPPLWATLRHETCDRVLSKQDSPGTEVLLARPDGGPEAPGCAPPWAVAGQPPAHLRFLRAARKGVQATSGRVPSARPAGFAGLFPGGQLPGPCLAALGRGQSPPELGTLGADSPLDVGPKWGQRAHLHQPETVWLEPI